MANKGTPYERKICKELSLWWTHGQRDDVFWRTAGSGARATVRSKKNKRTFGNHGDVQATDPIGQPLIDLFAIELKRGYPAALASNIVDKKERMKEPELVSFMKQAIRSRDEALAISWMVIHQRDQRESTILLPFRMAQGLNNKMRMNEPSLIIKTKAIHGRILQIQLTDFFLMVTPKDVARVIRELSGGSNDQEEES